MSQLLLNPDQPSMLDHSKVFDFEEGINQTVSALLLEKRTRLSAATDRKATITEYYSLLGGLTEIREQWQTFLDLTCSMNGAAESNFTSTDVNQAVSRSIKQWESELKNDEKLSPIGLGSIVTAEFANRPVSELKQLLLDQSEALIQEFSQHSFRQLVRLVELRVIGVARWFGDNCQYAYFSREVRSRESKRFIAETDDAERWAYEIETLHDVRAHEHHLIDARREAASCAKISMPAAVRGLLADSPTWIVDQMELITGTLVLENISIVEQTANISTKIEEVPKVAFDPALTIGPFVLTGWGPRDEARIEAELEREELADDEIRSYWAVGTVVLAFLSIVFGSSEPLWDLVGMAFCAVAGICIGTLARERLIRSTGSATRANIRLAAAVSVGLSAGLALQAVLVGMIQLGVVLMAVIVAAAILFVLSDPRSLKFVPEQIRKDETDV